MTEAKHARQQRIEAYHPKMLEALIAGSTRDVIIPVENRGRAIHLRFQLNQLRKLIIDTDHKAKAAVLKVKVAVPPIVKGPDKRPVKPQPPQWVKITSRHRDFETELSKLDLGATTSTPSQEDAAPRAAGGRDLLDEFDTLGKDGG